MKLQSKLSFMRDKVYLFNTIEHKIIDFTIKADTVFIATDKRLIQLNEDEALKTLENDFLPVDGSSLPVPVNSMLQKIESLDLIGTLKNNIKLLEGENGEKNIKKVHAINTTINTALNIVKTEFAVKKVNR